MPAVEIPEWVHEMRARQRRIGTRAVFDEMVGTCRQRVIREQWVDLWDVPLVPSHEELSGLKVRSPRKLKFERPPSKQAECVGFDDRGRVVLVESWTSLALDKGEQCVACECRLHNRDTTEIVRYQHRSSPESPATRWLQWEGDPQRLVRERSLSFRGSYLSASEVSYSWLGGPSPRPERESSWSAEWKIHERIAGAPVPPELKQLTTSESSYEYDGEGLLRVNGQLLDTWPVFPREMGYRQPGDEFVEYRRLPKGIKFKELEAKLESALVVAAAGQIKLLKLTEPLYGMLVVYTREGAVVPPFLAIGLDCHRHTIVERLGKRASEELWIPAELIQGEGRISAINLDTDPEVAELCALYEQFLEAKRDVEPGVRLCRKVAKRLMEYDWSGMLCTTDDFIVRADDLDGGDDPMKNLKASVPKELVQRLRKAGLH